MVSLLEANEEDICVRINLDKGERNSKVSVAGKGTIWFLRPKLVWDCQFL